MRSKSGPDLRGHGLQLMKVPPRHLRFGNRLTEIAQRYRPKNPLALHDRHRQSFCHLASHDRRRGVSLPADIAQQILQTIFIEGTRSAPASGRAHKPQQRVAFVVRTKRELRKSHRRCQDGKAPRHPSLVERCRIRAFGERASANPHGVGVEYCERERPLVLCRERGEQGTCDRH